VVVDQAGNRGWKLIPLVFDLLWREKNFVGVGVQGTLVVVGSQMVVELVHGHMDLDHCQVHEYLVGLEEELNHHNSFNIESKVV